LMWLDFNKMKEEEIKKLEEEGNTGHVGRHLSITVYIEDALSFKQLVAGWHELFNLAKSLVNWLLAKDFIENGKCMKIARPDSE